MVSPFTSCASWDEPQRGPSTLHAPLHKQRACHHRWPRVHMGAYTLHAGARAAGDRRCACLRTPSHHSCVGLQHTAVGPAWPHSTHCCFGALLFWGARPPYAVRYLCCVKLQAAQCEWQLSAVRCWPLNGR